MQYNNVFLDWLHRRKITDEVIKDFEVTFGIHDSLSECIIIPIKDENGDFSFNKYRRNPLDDAKPKYLYDKGGKMTLYGAWNIKDKKTVIICEGELDALVVWSANIPAVSSTGGAMSFPKEWADLLKDKEVIICFDNDEAGGNGMAKVFDIIPWAKILFLPDRPGVKDISDYVTNGGDLHSLIKTALRFDSLESVIANRSDRVSVWQSTYFHDAFIKEHTKPEPVARKPVSANVSGKIERARSYPIDSLLSFNKGKVNCLWHNEKTASMHYYRQKNKVKCFGCGKAGDPIDVYQQLKGCSFKEALEALQ